MNEHKSLVFDGRTGMYFCHQCSKCWETGEEVPECVAPKSGRDRFLQLKQELSADGKREVKQAGDA